MTVKELEEIFSRIIDKLNFEIGLDSRIKVKTDTYRIIPQKSGTNSITQKIGIQRKK